MALGVAPTAILRRLFSDAALWSFSAGFVALVGVQMSRRASFELGVQISWAQFFGNNAVLRTLSEKPFPCLRTIFPSLTNASRAAPAAKASRRRSREETMTGRPSPDAVKFVFACLCADKLLTAFGKGRRRDAPPFGSSNMWQLGCLLVSFARRERASQPLKPC